MSAAPPPSFGENQPAGPGPDFTTAPYGQNSASSGPSASVPGSVPQGYGDPATNGQPTPAYSLTQPDPASYGTPAQGPFVGNPAQVDPYAANQPQPEPYPLQYPPTQGYLDPTAHRYAPGQGYVPPNAAPYAPAQGYEPPFTPNQGYAPPYAPNQRYGDPMQGYQQPGAYPAYGLAPMGITAPLPQGMAVGAMVCGITGVVLSLCGGWSIPLSIVGIVLGAIGVQKAGRGTAGGRGMAITGIITGAVGLAVSMIVILIWALALASARG